MNGMLVVKVEYEKKCQKLLQRKMHIFPLMKSLRK